MKNKKRKWLGWLLALVCMASLLFAVPVSAEMADSEKEVLAQTVQDYLTSIFSLDDATYEQLRAGGAVYEAMVDTILENKEVAGDLEKIGEVKVEENSTAITCKAEAKFEKYDAEVVLTLDTAATTPTNLVINIQYSLGESMKQAGMNTLTGLIVVFVILIFLAGVISLFGVFSRSGGKNEGQGTEQPDVAEPVVSKQQAPAAQIPEDVELAVVLAAAIAAAEEEKPSNDGYVVRSIKKVNTTRRWKRV